ncbi:hypothetical protein J6590_029661 [Homalodisca vitripennis]|nr:hypothetical protein J6590_029661 [Homalodisca vitripennis]
MFPMFPVLVHNQPTHDDLPSAGHGRQRCTCFHEEHEMKYRVVKSLKSQPELWAFSPVLVGKGVGDKRIAADGYGPQPGSKLRRAAPRPPCLAPSAGVMRTGTCMRMSFLRSAR